MSSVAATAQTKTQQAATQAKEPSTWLMLLARAGYAARGVVYIMIGIIAFSAAFSGEQAEGSTGAIQEFLDEPYGPIIVSLIAIGLLGYAIWRAVQAILDVDHHGTDGKGLVVRAGLGVSAITHTILALYAFGLMFGGSSGGSSDGGGSSSQEATRWVMSQPFGKWLVILAGLCVAGAGVAHVAKAVKEGYKKWIDLSESTWKWANPVCKVGLIARGIAFGIIGGFLVWAGWTSNPDEARGLAGALQSVKEQPFGPYLLAAVAIGLLAFAAYSLIEACARNINSEEAVS